MMAARMASDDTGAGADILGLRAGGGADGGATAGSEGVGEAAGAVSLGGGFW